METQFVLSGLLVGVVVGLTGVGGGSLMTPLLVTLFGVPPATAIGTDLLYAGITKGVGSAFQGWQRRVDWRVTGLLVAGSLPASVLSAAFLSRLSLESGGGARFLTTALAAALLLTALVLPLRGRLARATSVAAGGHRLRPGLRLGIATVAVGVLLGVFVTLTSVGAGALGTLALCFLYPRLPTNEVIGTELAHAVPLTLVAGAGHAIFGVVDYGLLASLLLGSVPGVLLGSVLGGRTPEQPLRVALSVVLALVSVKLLW
ncbi:MAG: TSUP family transporter [Betaproteobacteria bacterium]|nr:TSUP family transporter [Betaproteobacteria bacterium]